MKFGESVRLFRQQKGLTQEKLGELLGVSSQAVSKWETMESYPDAELLVPLSGALGVSLDVLFRNEQVTERDVAIQVSGLIQREHERTGKDPFETVRRLCWTMETAMFGELETEPCDGGMSCIVADNGFTEISNDPDAPFFTVFPEPEGGWGSALGDGEEARRIFCAFAHEPTMKAVLFLLRQRNRYLFEDTRLTTDPGIEAEEVPAVIEGLKTLGLVSETPVEINGETRRLYYYWYNERLMPLLLLAKFVRYNSRFHYQSDCRDDPFLRPGK